MNFIQDSSGHFDVNRKRSLKKYRWAIAASVVVFLVTAFIMNALPSGLDRGIGGILLTAFTACMSVASGVFAIFAFIGWFIAQRKL